MHPRPQSLFTNLLPAFTTVEAEADIVVSPPLSFSLICANVPAALGVAQDDTLFSDRGCPGVSREHAPFLECPRGPDYISVICLDILNFSVSKLCLLSLNMT